MKCPALQKLFLPASLLSIPPAGRLLPLNLNVPINTQQDLFISRWHNQFNSVGISYLNPAREAHSHSAPAGSSASDSQTAYVRGSC